MEQADDTFPDTQSTPIPPWQRLMTGQGFLIELHRLYDARFLLELEMLVGPKANVDDLRKGVEAAARAYILAASDTSSRHKRRRTVVPKASPALRMVLRQFLCAQCGEADRRLA